MKCAKTKKSLALLVSLALLLCLGVGSTLAILVDVTGVVKNIFQPSKVSTAVSESFDGKTKTNVKIQNTGDIKANIRAEIVVTWQNAAGDVYGAAPVKGTDYEIVLDLSNGWTENADGYYYWSEPVAPNGYTGVLITSCQPVPGAAPAEGYALTVEILASGIQTGGFPTGSHPWGNE